MLSKLGILNIACELQHPWSCLHGIWIPLHNNGEARYVEVKSVGLGGNGELEVRGLKVASIFHPASMAPNPAPR